MSYPRKRVSIKSSNVLKNVLHEIPASAGMTTKWDSSGSDPIYSISVYLMALIPAAVQIHLNTI